MFHFALLYVTIAEISTLEFVPRGALVDGKERNRGELWRTENKETEVNVSAT